MLKIIEREDWVKVTINGVTIKENHSLNTKDWAEIIEVLGTTPLEHKIRENETEENINMTFEVEELNKLKEVASRERKKLALNKYDKAETQLVKEQLKYIEKYQITLLKRLAYNKERER